MSLFLDSVAGPVEKKAEQAEEQRGTDHSTMLFNQLLLNEVPSDEMIIAQRFASHSQHHCIESLHIVCVPLV